MSSPWASTTNNQLQPFVNFYLHQENSFQIALLCRGPYPGGLKRSSDWVNLTVSSPGAEPTNSSGGFCSGGKGVGGTAWGQVHKKREGGASQNPPLVPWNLGSSCPIHPFWSSKERFSAFLARGILSSDHAGAGPNTLPTISTAHALDNGPRLQPKPPRHLRKRSGHTGRILAVAAAFCSHFPHLLHGHTPKMMIMTPS